MHRIQYLLIAYTRDLDNDTLSYTASNVMSKISISFVYYLTFFS